MKTEKLLLMSKALLKKILFLCRFSTFVARQLEKTKMSRLIWLSEAMAPFLPFEERWSSVLDLIIARLTLNMDT